jgi:hypothetical protein
VQMECLKKTFLFLILKFTSTFCRLKSPKSIPVDLGACKSAAAELGSRLESSVAAAYRNVIVARSLEILHVAL